MEQDKSVTFQFLEKFSQKCEKTFKKLPTIDHDGSLSGIILTTDRIWQSANSGIDVAYIHLDASDYDGSVNSDFIFNISSGNEGGHGLNNGDLKITDAIAFKNSETNCINFFFKTNAEFLSVCKIDFTFVFNGEIIPKTEVTITRIENYTEEPVSYIYLIADGYNLPSGWTVVFEGNIVNQYHEETLFTIKGADNQDRQYPQTTTFTSIKTAGEAIKLNHGLSVVYCSPAAALDEEIVIKDQNDQNYQFEPNQKLFLPLPPSQVSQVANSGDFYQIRLDAQNQSIEGISTQIPRSTEYSCGGFIAAGESVDDLSSKAFVRMNVDGSAYIKKWDLGGSYVPKTDTFSTEEMEASSHVNQIYQYVGETTDDFVNGYFYKSTGSNTRIAYDSQDTPYSVGTNGALKLQTYIIQQGISLDLTKRFELYVDSADWITTEGATFSDLNVFRIVNNENGNRSQTEIVLSQQELYNVLDVTLKDEWKNLLLAGYSYLNTILYFNLNTNVYQWVQWDVQPRGNGSYNHIRKITNEEIDYLFATHVLSITLNTNAITGPINYQETLVATVYPGDATNPNVVWESDDTSIAVVTSDGTVTLLSEGDCNIQCYSVSEPWISDVCHISVVGI